MQEQTKPKNQKIGFSKLRKFGVTKIEQLKVKGGGGGDIEIPIQ